MAVTHLAAFLDHLMVAIQTYAYYDFVDALDEDLNHIPHRRRSEVA
ncbi:hypothetical protein JWS13_32720 [Rhodococcus pseudokoreensis]|uniref:Uncharacterized protein n=1 Tax=Rhodococcus pseudokoreensis TaxID=2811421 RepID=A0A974W8C9_9NOCA|nr:hypothetical protein [Rhodococcus pseudokoreensis]QSE93015.1 hypothetical protein JWS13_32720 [Rhodococcus pseudokoreensis]